MKASPHRGKGSTSRRAHGVVFDFDGLLVDSDGAWRTAYVAAAQSCDGAVARLDADRLLGASVETAAHELGRQLRRRVSSHDLLKALTAAFIDEPPPAMPGAYTLTEALSGRMPLAVATNGPRELVDRALADLRLRHHFATVVSAEGCDAPKPAPQVYELACRQLGVEPASALALEDSPLGVAAARRAGMRVVGVSRTGMRLDADLSVSRLDDPRLLWLLGVERQESRRG
jgi:HAD superfamily hydrolase (TIGR01509 family)